MERYGRPQRASDFLREISTPKIQEPDPSADYGMYREMNIAFAELAEYLESLRRNYGAVGYSGQNLMSDLSKAAIDAVINGDDNGAEELLDDIQRLSDGFSDAVAKGALPDTGNSFSRNMWQENQEAELFAVIWPVITGKSTTISRLTWWRSFKGNVQAFLYGYLDVVPELGKAVTEELSEPNVTTEYEFAVFERYLAIARSIVLRLSQLRHVPGYVISNGFGHWMAYSRKLRTAQGTIAHVQRDYNLRRSMQRMIQSAMERSRSSAI